MCRRSRRWVFVACFLIPILSSYGQEDTTPTPTLEIRGPTTYLFPSHNRVQDGAWKVGLVLGSQLPFQAIAKAVAVAGGAEVADFVDNAAWFVDAAVSYAFFYNLEVGLIAGLGLWSSEALIDPVVFRSLTLDLTQIEVSIAALYKFLYGDLVPFVSLQAGLAFTDATLIQNFAARIDDTITATLFVAVGGAGLDIYVTPYVGIRMLAALALYTNLTNLNKFVGVGGTEKAVFPNTWANLLVTTEVFYEF